MKKLIETEHSIVLFDGVCNLCQSSVQFVIRRDPKALFRFASLQSVCGQQLAQQFAVTESKSLNTIILIEGGNAYYRSTAALKILKRLDTPWSFFHVFIILPVKIRDFIYDFIGQRRYKWFGKKEACWVPDTDLSQRFLDKE